MPSRDRTRRQWLATCAGATVGLAALAGCSNETDGDAPDPGDDPGAIADDSDYGAWPMVRYNATNRLSVPHSGLSGEPEIRWTVEFDSPGAISPPVVFGGTTFVSHSNGTYTAIDLDDSSTVWEYDSSSWVTPAVSEDAVFVAGDGIEALGHDNASVQWTTGHEGTVETVRIFDDSVYAGIDDQVIAVNNDGEEELAVETAATVQALAVVENAIYVRSRPDEDEDDFVMAGFDRESGEKRWEEEISHAQQWSDDRVTRTFPVIDDTIYTVTNDALISIDGTSGDREQIVEPETPAWTRPTIYDQTAYMERGSMAYDLETGETPAEWDPEQGSDTPPVFASGTGYTINSANPTDPHELVAIDPATGEVFWKNQAAEQTNFFMPIVLNGLILIMEDSSVNSHRLTALE